MPDEYAHSNYSAKLKGALAKTKANAAQAIPEMIEISTHGIYSSNADEKKYLYDVINRKKEPSTPLS